MKFLEILFIKIHEMLQELEITTNLITDDTELGFSDDFQNEWA